MKWLVVVAAVLAVFVVVPTASAIDVEVSIASPVDGAHSLSGVVPVTVDASSDVGIYSVQLQVDGKYYGVPDLVPSPPFVYTISVDTSTLAQGTHTITAVATDWSQIGGGQRWASDPITVDVGPAYPTISLTAPQPNAVVRGAVSVQTTSTSAVSPATTSLAVDGVALASSTWDTTKATDGTHTVSATITDGRGKQATASETVTVDNTPPATSILAPAAGTYAQGTLAASASASDATSGIQSVQFLVDGAPSGMPLTAPDGGSGSSYSESLNVSGLANGAHTLSDVATDAAGNTTTSAPVSFTIGPLAPAVSLTLPADWTFAHGTVPVAASVSGGTAPESVTFLVDGSPASTDTTAPYTFSWNTSTLSDGAHTLQATVTDAIGRTASSSIVHQTVDNTPPVTYVTAPSPNTYFQTTMAVQANASDAYGVQSVQFAIDGVATGPLITAPDTAGGYLYSSTLNVAALAPGVHSLTDIATNNAGVTTTSSPVAFDVGVAPGVASISSPLAFGFAHGTQPVTASILGGTGPFTAQLIVDGVATSTPAVVTGSSFSFQWNTTGLADGSHSIVVAVSGADGATSYSTAVTVTVDNTGPEAIMYLPASTPGYAYLRSNGPTQLQVHASDAFGVKSVQFTVDGKAFGAPILAPDTAGSYLYSTTLDASTLAAGLHSVTAIVTDNAGNVTTAAPLSIKSGPIVYWPVLNYHGITGPLDEAPDIYDESPAQADAELAYLKANGYQSTTVEQYQTWLTTGALPAGITKPVLITVDDGLTDEEAWDALLQKYGMKAVLFVVTGFADNTTPGANDPTGNLSWTQIEAYAKNGRWEIAFHAGEYGHGDFSEATNTISLGSGQVESFSPTCFAYYNCLGTITTTTTTGTGLKKKTTVTTAPETPAQFESQVTAEVTAGLTELKSKVPTASLVSWACPWNACGQWTNFYDDASGTVQSWMPQYFASKFPIVFTQTDPITYGLASGTVGALNGFNRHYRFEVHTDTTIAQFAASLTDPGFANN
ncbi:MAG TPA: Ig-like domain-containing protein [Gaiellaceae bacterium]|nr:Ig-like domain-containing protein [Gaiellaceae bacterium]